MLVTTRIRVTERYPVAPPRSGATAEGGFSTMGSGSLVDRVSGRVFRRMVAARERGATTTFMLGSVAASDRVLSGVWFALFAHRWARMAEEASHVAAYRAGLAQLGAPASILDLGTGAGASAAAAAERFPAARVIGFDLSRAMLRAARGRHAAPNLEFRRGSVLALPFPDDSFDAVTSLNAIVEPAEVGRVLRPGGLVLSASSIFSMRPATSAWVGRWLDCGFQRIDARDVQPGSWEMYRRSAD
jgi:SAM-dependent methyltransferase